MSITAMVWALKKAPVSEPVEALILVGLADHAGDDGTDAYPSQALLAKYGRCSPSTVKRRLSSLEDAGLIRRGDQQKVAHLQSNRRPIVWDLNLHMVTCAGKHAEDVIDHPEEILGGQADPPVTSDPPNLGGSDGSGGSPGTSWGVTQDVLGGHGWPTNRPLTIQEPSITEEFDQWYSMYPRKEARTAALKAFTKARKSADLDALMAGLSRYVTSVKGKDRQYIALPASWLNAGRWEDEYAPARQQAVPSLYAHFNQ